ncbi:MAG: STAS domain-containing protein [Planctomycetota bacterium]|nr:MAG: STAS domain-containing protein [Planctomycetota bacterium]
MKIKFWGARGSIATPEPENMHYGGNTSCVEIRTAAGEVLIIDAGTGIRKLGLSLLQDPHFSRSKKGTIFLSHFHWDHIQGFPFFVPAFIPGYHFKFYGQFKMGGRLEESLRGQMEHAYFPVRLSDMQSTLEFHEILEETVYVGDTIVTSRYLNHPQGCFGYRIEDQDGIVVYCSDTEHFPNTLDKKVLELAEGADILIYDAQYTEEEYLSKVGWGHSTWNEGVKICREAGVKQLILFHHDPTHNDKFIAKLEKEAQSEFPNTIAASRELELNLQNKRSLSPPSAVELKTHVYLPGELEERGDILIIRAPSSLSEFSSASYREKVLEQITPRFNHIVVDLEKLKNLDSAALGTLAAFMEKVQKIQAKYYLYRISDFNREILEISRFTHFLTILDDLSILQKTS